MEKSEKGHWLKREDFEGSLEKLYFQNLRVFVADLELYVEQASL